MNKPTVLWLHLSKKEPSWLNKIKSLVTTTKIPKSAQYILVIGGDGAMLHALQEYSYLNIPFIGCHAGTRGFLMNDFIDQQTIPDSFKSLQFETLSLLEATIKTSSGEHKITAFNDIWVERQIGQVLKMKVIIDGVRQSPLIIGDGMLVSTPQGSTGYNRALRGKIILPSVPILQITPIACVVNKTPIASILLPSVSKICIEFKERKKRPARCYYDGVELTHSELISISFQQSERTVKLGFLRNSSFLSKVFSWQFQS